MSACARQDSRCACSPASRRSRDCAWLDAKERSLMYRPTPEPLGSIRGLGAGGETSLLSVPGDRSGTTDQVALWWLPPSDPFAPTLFYLHGTFRNLYRNYPKIEALHDAGFGVLAVEYRGWGDSTPMIPSEKTIIADAEAAWPRAGTAPARSAQARDLRPLARRRRRDRSREPQARRRRLRRADRRIDVPEPGRPRRLLGRTARAARPLALGRALRLACQDRSHRRTDPHDRTATTTTRCRWRSAASFATRRRPAFAGSRSRAAPTAACTPMHPRSTARRSSR